MSLAATLSAAVLFDGTTEHRGVELTLAPDGTVLSLKPVGNPQTGTITPTFLDIHFHGARGYDVMSATPAELTAIHRFLANHGVGWYLPTTVTAPVDTLLHALERLADAVERPPQPLEAQPVGIHLEGPFLAETKRGVHPTEHLQQPSTALFDRFQDAARGHIRLLTLAPELPGAADLVRHAAQSGVRVSLGHTNARAAETLAALELGANSATHTFNAMRPLDHREPGVLGTVLDDKTVYSELICDGVHVAPPLVRLWLKAKGPDRVLLVTDAMAATGEGDGAYTLGGLPVTVTDGRALLTNDLAAGKEVIAGSTLTLDAAVANFMAMTGTPLLTAVRAVTRNPAAMLDLPQLIAIAPGQPANLNVFDGTGRLKETLIRGERVPR